MKRSIEVNLSVERSGGAEKLREVIDVLQKKLEEHYPNDAITVRKGYFQTIDGIFSSDATVEADVRTILAEVRTQVLA